MHQDLVRGSAFGAIKGRPVIAAKTFATETGAIVATGHADRC